MMGVRASVWLALFTSVAFFVAVLSRDGGEASVAERRTQVAPVLAVRPAPRPALGAHAAGRAPPRVRVPRQVAAAASRSLETTSPRAVPPPADARSGELVGLEREAADLAVSEGLLDRADLDAAVAALERAPGESPEDFERRVDAFRESLASSEFLVQHQLSELFESTVYPHGFPVEQLVVAQERQLVGSLPPEERAARLRGILGEWEPARSQPRFETPESGRVWEGGTPDL